MKKINLKKLAKLEKTYNKSCLSTDTLHRMVSVVLDATDGKGVSYALSLTTLQDLGVIVDDEETK